METAPSSVTMCAVVVRACRCALCVCDCESDQRVLVHTPDACCFRAGQRVCITYSGAMTRSDPPQITAESIRPVRCC